MIKHIRGNLIDNAGRAEAIAHGVNCKGFMGAGVAKAVRQRWPDMYAVYRAACEKEQDPLSLGQVLFWGAPSGLIIANIATQVGIGRGVQADLGAIEQGLIKTAKWLSVAGLTSLAIPHIGSGLGGLSWEKNVWPVVECLFEKAPFRLFVHEWP